MSKSTLEQFAPGSAEFRKWLQRPGFRAPLATVLHHTAAPKAADYVGRKTIENIRKYHIESRGFSDIAANAYACPDGTVITGRPLDTDNWAHAYIERPKPLPNLDAYWGGNRQYLNRYGFGIETVANFSSENPAKNPKAAKSLETALKVLSVVHGLFNIPVERCFFHRQAANKDCPGKFLDLNEIRQELSRLLANSKAAATAKGLPKVVGPDSNVIDCSPIIVDGEVLVKAGALLDYLGVPLTAIRPGVIRPDGMAFISMLARDIPQYKFFYKEMAQGPRVYIKKI